ncbi:MAG: TonB-dependent receptor [Acidobacteriota bacterium]|nr:TonB-dependent receptor [Acidobacteriota bacterium]
MRKISLVAILMLVVGLTASIFSYGQATASGAVVGTVTDSSGAVVSGATVTITNDAIGLKRTTVTNSIGSYRFDLLSAGKYKVTIAGAGFSTVAQSVELLVGQTATANASLKPGAASQTIEVEGTAPLVDTQKTSVSEEITPSDVANLPMVGQDVANLAYLAPGVKATDSYDPTKNRYAILSVNGDGGRNVNVTVNGVDNKDNTVGGPVMQLPAEAIQEFHISTQRFSAENGRSEGAAINIITKRGTNSFHGSGIALFRETGLNTDEKDPDGHGGTTTSHPDYTRQQFGGSIGGPVIKDKGFLFFAINREREHQSATEETVAFEELTAAQPYFNGVEPISSIPRPFFETRYNGRADWVFNPRESAYLSYSSQGNNSLNDQSDGSGDATAGNFTVNHMQIANFTLNSILSDTTVNQATVGFQYWNNLIASNVSAPLVTFPSAYFGTNGNVPQQSYQRKWQFKDDFSKAIGRHTLKGGVDYIWTPVQGGFFEYNSTLEIDFGADPTCILATVDNADQTCGPTPYPDGFQTAGAVTSMSQANGDPYFNVKTKQFGLYFQDDWKLNRRITVNAGIRWDKDYNFIGGSDIKDSKTYLLLVALNSPVSNPYLTKIAKDDNFDFSPRVGFAIDLSGRGNHVLRGGYGLYFGNIFQNIPLFMEQQSNPTVFQTALSLSSPTEDVPGTGKTLGEWQYGIDSMPDVPAPSSQLAKGSVGRLMDPKYRNPVAEEFNLGYTWAVDTKSAIEVEYTHVLSLHTNRTINIDQKIPINGVLTRPLDPYFAASPYNDQSFASVRNEESIGREHYDGFNFSYNTRVTNKFELRANYTLAWAYGYDSGGGSFRNYPRLSTNPFASYEWGPSPNDERHHVAVAGFVNLPKGFIIAPILSYGSPRPYNLTSSSNTLNTGGGTANAVVVPNYAPTDYFAFAGNNTGAQNCFYGLNNTAANCTIAKYDPLRGDPFFQLDARLAKDISFRERLNIQLVAEAFNLTNRSNYGGNFGNNIASASTFGHPTGFINPSSTIVPRATWGELGFKVTF